MLSKILECNEIFIIHLSTKEIDQSPPEPPPLPQPQYQIPPPPSPPPPPPPPPQPVMTSYQVQQPVTPQQSPCCCCQATSSPPSNAHPSCQPCQPNRKNLYLLNILRFFRMDELRKFVALFLMGIPILNMHKPYLIFCLFFNFSSSSTEITFFLNFIKRSNDKYSTFFYF